MRIGFLGPQGTFTHFACKKANEQLKECMGTC